MQLKYAAVAFLCVAEQAYSVSAKNDLSGLVETPVRRSDITISHERIHKRLAAPDALPQASASVSSSSAAAPSMAMVMNSTTEAACVSRLSALKGIASSPSGMSVCYDVSTLDMMTGAFESQVYLYQVSAATGNWTNVDTANMFVSIGYAGANLSQSSLNKRFSEAVKRDNTVRHLVGRATVPALISTESYSGKVISGWNSTDETQMMNSLMPTVIVTAKTSAGEPLSDTLSKMEADFVTGIFSDKAAAQASAAAVSATSTPFVLPGVTIAFFPIGMITTGVWMVLFVTVIGLGTLGRLQFRQSYRRRAGYNNFAASSKKSGMAAYDRR